MPIITAAEVATILGVSATDPVLVALVAGANQYALTECRPRTFEKKDRVEYCRGFGLDFLFLRESPIASIAEVRVDSTGVFADDSIVADLTLFAFNPDEDDPRLWYRGTAFPEGPRVVRVSYNAGYAAANGAAGPDDLRAELLADVCAQFKLGLDMSGFTGIRQGDVTYTRFADGISDRLKKAIKRNKWKGI